MDVGAIGQSKMGLCGKKCEDAYCSQENKFYY